MDNINRDVLFIFLNFSLNVFQATWRLVTLARVLRMSLQQNMVIKKNALTQRCTTSLGFPRIGQLFLATSIYFYVFSFMISNLHLTF